MSSMLSKKVFLCASQTSHKTNKPKAQAKYLAQKPRKQILYKLSQTKKYHKIPQKNATISQQNLADISVYSAVLLCRFIALCQNLKN